MGPCGELRYPSYPANSGWMYPGIGEFQCYDKYLKESLKAASEAVGEPSWAEPPNAGEYNDTKPLELDFFKKNGHYNGFRGRFFLRWYSDVFLAHADGVLAEARRVFADTLISAKVAGVHWHYKTVSHAAELTAGFYNTLGTAGYGSILQILKKHGAILNFTCVELSTEEQQYANFNAQSDPEALVWQVIQEAWAVGVPVAAENALPFYHWDGYKRILKKVRPEGAPRSRPNLVGFTYLRLCPELFEEANWKNFQRFVAAIHGY